MAEALPYARPSQFREVAYNALTSAAADGEYDRLLLRASRVFDRLCHVPDGYFSRAVFDAWQAAQAYEYGELVRPTAPNAHVYRVTVAGTSHATTEPAWPTTASTMVVDQGVTFQEAGAEGATPRVFYGDGLNFLKLPPFVAGSLTVITMPSGYTVPAYAIQGSYLWVKDATSGVLTEGVTSGWLTGVPVTVTARWGFESTPADVVQAVIQIAIHLWRGSDAAFAKTTDLTVPAEAIPATAQAIINAYRTKSRAAFV